MRHADFLSTHLHVSRRHLLQLCSAGAATIAMLPALGRGGAGKLLGAACTVLPNLHLFTPSGSALGGQAVSVHGAFVGASYLGWTTVYALGYSAVVLACAMLIFRRRDFV